MKNLWSKFGWKTTSYFSVIFAVIILGALVARSSDKAVENVTIAILAKDKAHFLPTYLRCIEKQTWPKAKTNIYIRTNNNNDNTDDILKDWIQREGHNYAKVFLDVSDVPEQVQKYGPYEWNSERFVVLSKIRQDSLNWAKKENSHYFVVDCDNFIFPNTIEAMVKTNLPIVAPFLRMQTNALYSNYHSAVDGNGYLLITPLYYNLIDQQIRGLIEVPVVHSAYFIRNEFLDQLSYNDDSGRYEYVIFSHSARRKNIPQYLDNRQLYGRISFAENAAKFAQEEWLYEFSDNRLEELRLGHTPEKPIAVLNEMNMGQGLFSVFFTIASYLDRYDRGELAGVHVDLGNQGLYYERAKGYNWWEYYCEPLKIGASLTPNSNIEKSSGLTANHIAFECEQKLSKDRLVELQRKYIKIKPAILQKVDNFIMDKFQDNFVIGIHFRGTDKFSEATHVSYERVAKEVEDFIKRNDFKKPVLFIATDEQAFLDYMQQQFPGKIIAQDCCRSQDGNKIHVHNPKPYEHGKEAVIDCLILSRCNVLFRTSSNLSLWSTYFNPDLPDIALNKRK